MADQQAILDQLIGALIHQPTTPGASAMNQSVGASAPQPATPDQLESSATPQVSAQSPGSVQSSDLTVAPYPYAILKAHTAKCESCDKKNKGVGWQCTKCILKFCQACIQSKGEATIRLYHPPCFRKAEEADKPRRRRKRVRESIDKDQNDTKATFRTTTKADQSDKTAKAAKRPRIEDHKGPMTEDSLSDIASDTTLLSSEPHGFPQLLDTKHLEEAKLLQIPVANPISTVSLPELASNALEDVDSPAPTKGTAGFVRQTSVSAVPSGHAYVNSIPSSRTLSDGFTDTWGHQSKATGIETGKPSLSTDFEPETLNERFIPYFDGADDPKPHTGVSPITVLSAGIVGLCIAYQLAKRGYESGIQQAITVLDYMYSPEDSNMDTGRLIACDKHANTKVYIELGRHSARIWRNLCRPDEVAKRVGYAKRQSTVPPHWLSDKGDQLIDAGLTRGGLNVLNPTRMTSWLKNQCRIFGVQFIPCSRIINITDDFRGTVTGVKYETPGAQTHSNLACKSVVLALGDSTEAVLRDIYGTAGRLRLNLVREAQDWMLLHDPWPQPHPRVLRADQLAGFPMDIVNRDDNTFYIAGPVGKCTRTQSRTPNEERLAKMCSEAERLIVGPPKDEDGGHEAFHARIIKKGRKFYTSTRTGIPIIAKLSISYFDPYRVYAAEDSKRSGLFFCAGYGEEGYALGMGMAEVMADLVDGTSLQEDLPFFDVAKYLVSN